MSGDMSMSILSNFSFSIFLHFLPVKREISETLRGRPCAGSSIKFVQRLALVCIDLVPNGGKISSCQFSRPLSLLELFVKIEIKGEKRERHTIFGALHVLVSVLKHNIPNNLII
jgi:hypothetical protein